MAASVLLPAGVSELEAKVSYGEYLRQEQYDDYKGPPQWRCVPHEETVTLAIGQKTPGKGAKGVPGRITTGRSSYCSA